MAAPATFLRRYAAYSVDVAIVLVIAVPLVAWQLGDVPAAFDMAVASLQQRLFELFDSALYDGALYDAGPFELARRWADDPGLRAGLAALADVVLDALVVAMLIVVLAAAVWFIGFESSARQATPGKAALGLRVIAVDGGRPSFGRVAARFIAGAPSWALLHLGHAMAAWTKDRRALHDLIAGTRVVQHDAPGTPLPAWATAWLFLQVAAVFGLSGFVLLRYAQLLNEAVGASG